MRVVLVGHPKSQHVRAISEYLTSKYLADFSVDYLSFEGPLQAWSTFVAECLKTLRDSLVILALDDYLLSGPPDNAKFLKAMEQMAKPGVACVKLCESSAIENAEYPVTTQYTVWNREYLIGLLERTTTPWNFETYGSKLFQKDGKKALHVHCMDYDVHSALSNRWEGMNLKGVQKSDIEHLKAHGIF